ncbi:hypothetical protein BMD20_29575 [Burkholderia multivorans]|nr:hypothetical protein BMD20_29575 [Burkholderia multivorans]KHS10380.1 hypothetical protein BMD22_28250 [Burkholderia multivorans]
MLRAKHLREGEVGRKLTIQHRHIAILVAGAVAVVAASYWFGREAGKEAGRRAIERIELVWPSVRSMPEQDRAILAGLGLTCRVQERPPVVSAIIACLQDAAADPNPILPKGVDRSLAQKRLSELLRQQLRT